MINGLRIITNYTCNKRCSFCYQKSYEGVINQYKLIDNLLRISMQDHKFKHITIMGGECTLLGEDLFYFISAIKIIFPDVPISITSNGSADWTVYKRIINMNCSITISYNNELDLIKFCDIPIRINLYGSTDNMDIVAKLAKHYPVTICEDIRCIDKPPLDIHGIECEEFERVNNYTFKRKNVYYVKHNYDQDNIIITPTGLITTDFQDVVNGK